jgi:hypothetical protein
MKTFPCWKKTCEYYVEIMLDCWSDMYYTKIGKKTYLQLIELFERCTRTCFNFRFV